MIRTFFTGVIVGIANIIPGVSGGSILVMMGAYERVMDIIANFLKKTRMEKISALRFLLVMVFGLFVGLIGFAKGVSYLLDNYFIITMWWFLGLICFSYPYIKRSELKGEKLHYPALIYGMLFVVLIGFFGPNKETTVVILPTLSFNVLLKMFLLGIIAGATMIIPGISGSLVLLILGQYYLFNTYISEITSMQTNVLIPVIALVCGIVIGIYGISLFMSKLLKIYHRLTISVILGFIIGSLFVIVPKSGYTLTNSLLALLFFTIGGILIFQFNKRVV